MEKIVSEWIPDYQDYQFMKNTLMQNGFKFREEKKVISTNRSNNKEILHKRLIREVLPDEVFRKRNT